MKEKRRMDSIDALFDQYDRGRMTRRGLMQALAMLALPAKIVGAEAAREAAPIVRGLGVNHVGLLVSDIERSYAFYHRLFGVKKGWPAKNNGTGVHLDFPTGYISVVPGPKSAFTHFSVSIDHTDQKSAKQLADKINEELPAAHAKAAFQPNDGVSTVNLVDPDGFHVQISPIKGR
jgi:catechol 2,3-dioxygenase-like lactoylglutathione lyase family enzyme